MQILRFDKNKYITKYFILVYTEIRLQLLFTYATCM